MEEQKKEELKQESAQTEPAGQQKSSTRSSILWIFAGGYLVYTGYRLCRNVLTGAEDASTGFLVAGGIFIVIGAVLLIMAVRNLAREGAQKQQLEEAAAREAAEEKPAEKKLSISERAHLAEHLDDAQETEENK